ncbi:MAG: hypothetical protein AAGF94_20655, partial [Pseudomonadota bacterium]
RDPATRGQYWWLFVMLFSTLLPTLAHASLALVSLFTLIPGRVQHWIAAWFKEGQEASTLGKLGRVSFVTLVTAAIYLPVYLAIWIVGHYRVVDDALIGLFYGIAQAMGAV